MTELKTLKEILKYTDDNHFEQDLKTEAVKWLKRLKDKKFYDNKENLYWFIEYFFNLTEEDLK